MEILKRLTKETASEYALRVIQHNIISLELLPGSLVSENELAKELGISRTPVREALIALNKIKLVEIYPQRGSYISLINHELVEEARCIRLILETAIVEEACDRAGEKEIMELEENLKLQEVYQDSANENKLLTLDNEFHEIFFKICRKEFTYHLLNGMMTHFDRVRRLSLTVVKDSKILSDHRALAEAIKSHDKQAARAVITKHLSRYELDEEALRKNYGEYFKKESTVI
ncbi:GntR family transcriptional regulator [Anaerocolumna chitinilytica]|uniref:Transcriptional regulator n=1 Tax=Anaerocolumna chitinilytica TaxID=1727145 RepID=A0A7I8DTK6_9FIRM|nr:GntR family transcriptional regulator [Anaerocolumna chitinilytica]BCK00366.1 transcriptional regulator [Anaerocolumna chitinilytica]